MRRLLIVSPHFPPTHAPDHQRVRMMLPHLRTFGWEPTVLALDPAETPAPQDPALERALPAGVRVLRFGAIPLRHTRRIGWRTIGLRCLAHLRAAASRLLAEERFDLVFFSTTAFATLACGPQWLERHALPYIVDLQDPWRTDFYERTGTRPPGGRLKYALAQSSARLLEPRAMRDAAHIVCVSPSYPEMLRRRFPELPADRFSVIPFAGNGEDFDAIDRVGARAAFERNDPGVQHWVSVGALGPHFADTLRVLFHAAIAAGANANRVRIHFFGTSYAGAEAESATQCIARECGIADFVNESTERLPYFDALATLRAADLVLNLGSSDPSYTPSKIYHVGFLRRPCVSLYHSQGDALRLLRSWRAEPALPFDDPATPERLAAVLTTQLGGILAAPAIDQAAFAPFTAEAMTQRLCTVFEGVAGAVPA